MKSPQSYKSRGGIGSDTRFTCLWVIIVIVILVLIGIGGYLYYDSHNTAEKESVKKELEIVARNKSSQISQWRTERTADAQAVMNSPLFARAFNELMQSPGDSSLIGELRQELAGIGEDYPYQDVLLVDRNGKVILSANHARQKLPDVINQAMPSALYEKHPDWVDFYLSSETGAPELALIAPLDTSSGNKQVAGAVVFIIDPSVFLYPAVQQWPATTYPTETVLVKQEGDQVLLLSNLQFQNQSSLKVSIPLSQQDLPEVMAVKGIEGTFSGLDQDGRKILAFHLQVPGSPWFMATKIAESEIISRTDTRMILVVTLSMAFMVLLAGAAGFLWQRKQRKRFQAVFKENNENKTLLNQFENMVRYANDSNLICDEKDLILQANDRSLETFGYSQDAMVGMNLINLISEKESAGFLQKLELGKSEGSFTAEIECQRQNGTVFPADISARVFNLEDSLFLQAIIRDISERKAREEEINRLNTSLEARVQSRTVELERSNRELESFVYAVSHDLRAPLRGITNWSQVLAEEHKQSLGEKGLQIVSSILAETQRMGQLIEDLLKFSRDTRGELRIEQVDLTALVQRVAARCQSASLKKPVQFVIQKQLTARCDSHLMEIAITNLIDNAVKFTARTDQPLILFGEIYQNGQRVFFVRDNGVGFDMAYADRLFKVFQRLHKPSEFPGTGIGLATVQRIINRHGGRIWTESYVDKGATFYFTLEESE
ncbi:MAG TPA: ATP-binding protein [Dehalococcoidales bacterium]|nr:ATP-binding protein [Dehalococcoidales bacterium]